MSQRNPIKSEFFTFYANPTGTDGEVSGAGTNFFAVNVSGSREVIITADALGSWFVTNKSYNEVMTAAPAIRRDAQIMPLPCCTNDRSRLGNNHLVTHTNDDMLYVFLDPDAEIKEPTRCFVWVIR